MAVGLAMVELRTGVCNHAVGAAPYAMVPVLKPVNIPPPLLNTVMAWLTGFAPPLTATNERLDDRSASVGGELLVTVKVTPSNCGLFDARGACTGIVAEYVPAGRPAVIGCTVSVAEGFAVVALREGICNQADAPAP